MDSSKILQDMMEECSSNESGWTMYIASPSPHELDDYDDDEDEENRSSGEQIYVGDAGLRDAHEDVDSDDSMASDASSGPSYQGRGSYEIVHGFRGFFGHAWNNKSHENKQVGEKNHKQQEEKKHFEQIKAVKDHKLERKKISVKNK